MRKYRDSPSLDIVTLVTLPTEWPWGKLLRHPSNEVDERRLVNTNGLGQHSEDGNSKRQHHLTITIKSPNAEEMNKGTMKHAF